MEIVGGASMAITIAEMTSIPAVARTTTENDMLPRQIKLKPYVEHGVVDTVTINHLQTPHFVCPICSHPLLMKLTVAYKLNT